MVINTQTNYFNIFTMKKVVFLVLFTVLSVGTICAQLPLSKGDFYVNANVSNLDLSFSDGTTDFTVGAYGGYFLIDKLALVAGLNVGASSHKVAGEKIKTNHFGIDVGVRYYFLEQSKGSFFVGDVLNIYKEKDVDATFGMTLSGGYAFFLNQNVSLEPMLSIWFPFSSDYDITFTIGGGISVYF